MKHTHGPSKHNVNQNTCLPLEQKHLDHLTGFHWNESVRHHAEVIENHPPKESYVKASQNTKKKNWI